MHEFHPPRPALALVIGVTGHRELSGEQAFREAFGHVLADADGCLKAIGARGASVFAEGAPALSVLSQLAAGTDQIAAEEALTRGHAIRAVLPFPLETFEQDFDNAGRARLAQLLARAEARWSLPGVGDTGYRMAGESMVAQADLVVALWDGGPARGPGGTADVVAHAIRRGVPVIHLPANGGAPRILWSGFEEVTSGLLDAGTVPWRAYGRDALAALIGRLLLPPNSPDELCAVTDFLAETEQRVRTRPEYPLLLAAMRIRRLSRMHFRADPFLPSVQREWSGYHQRMPADALAGERLAGGDLIETGFAWSDRLADHYAQTYRSGSIFNYVAAALSVLLALIGFLMPDAKLWLLVSEQLVVAALILNTHLGNRRQWHRRWLDYRFLAEQLRPMRSLKLVAAARPVRDAAALARGEQRWTDWYAASIWRTASPPPSIATPGAVAAVAAHIAAEELEPQIAYHRLNARRMHELDHRLHTFGTILFMLTLGLGLVALIGKFVLVHAIHDAGTVLNVLSAALPTIGAAIFGIRGQGDFAGASHRSLGTAAQLARQAQRLADKDIDLPVAVRVTEEAAAAMIADLNEWRLSYRDRKLAIPS